MNTADWLPYLREVGSLVILGLMVRYVIQSLDRLTRAIYRVEGILVGASPTQPEDMRRRRTDALPGTKGEPR